MDIMWIIGKIQNRGKFVQYLSTKLLQGYPHPKYSSNLLI